MLFGWTQAAALHTPLLFEADRDAELASTTLLPGLGTLRRTPSLPSANHVGACVGIILLKARRQRPCLLHASLAAVFYTVAAE